MLKTKGTRQNNFQLPKIEVNPLRLAFQTLREISPKLMRKTSPCLMITNGVSSCILKATWRFL